MLSKQSGMITPLLAKLHRLKSLFSALGKKTNVCIMLHIFIKQDPRKSSRIQEEFKKL